MDRNSPLLGSTRNTHGRFSLVIVNNLHIPGVLAVPSKAHSILATYTDAPLALPVALQFLKPVPGRILQLLNCARKILLTAFGAPQSVQCCPTSGSCRSGKGLRSPHPQTTGSCLTFIVTRNTLNPQRICYRSAMQKSPVSPSPDCRTLLLCFAISFFAFSATLAQDSTLASGTPQATPSAPADPKALMLQAAKLNGLTGDDLKPWHLKATYQLGDDGKTYRSGKPAKNSG